MTTEKQYWCRRSFGHYQDTAYPARSWTGTAHGPIHSPVYSAYWAYWRITYVKSNKRHGHNKHGKLLSLSRCPPKSPPVNLHCPRHSRYGEGPLDRAPTIPSRQKLARTSLYAAFLLNFSSIWKKMSQTPCRTFTLNPGRRLVARADKDPTVALCLYPDSLFKLGGTGPLQMERLDLRQVPAKLPGNVWQLATGPML